MPRPTPRPRKLPPLKVLQDRLAAANNAVLVDVYLAAAGGVVNRAAEIAGEHPSNFRRRMRVAGRVEALAAEKPAA